MLDARSLPLYWNYNGCLFLLVLDKEGRCLGAMHRNPAATLFDHLSTCRIGYCARVYSSPACSNSKRQKLCHHPLAISAVHQSQLVYATQTANAYAWHKPVGHNRQAPVTCRHVHATALNTRVGRRLPHSLVQVKC